MNEEAHCPRGVCATCAGAAVSAHEFRMFTRNSQIMWSKAVHLLSLLPLSSVTPMKSLCAFIKTEPLTMHIAKDFPHSFNDTKVAFKNLKSKFHCTLKRKYDKRTRTARNGPPCKCDDCGKSYGSPFYLNVHLKNSGQKAACHNCGVVLIRGQELKEHLFSIHGETTHLCNECPVLFTSELDLKSHKKTAHRPGALTCGDCGRTFQRNTSFEAHSQMHTVRTCRACGAQFSNRACYREHRSQCEPHAKPDMKTVPRNKRSNVRDPATFTCDHCGKTYNSRPQLKNHIIWIHMDVRPHQCQWCGKRFYTPARLAEHSVVHTRERNFECDICGAKLVSKMAAVYHRRRHTGEKPYECEDCGEKFISASRRSEHAKRRHNRGIRMQCVHCPANFVRGHELRKHVEKAHNKNYVITT